MSVEEVLHRISNIQNASDIAAFKACNRATYEWLEQGIHNLPIRDLVLGRSAIVDSMLQRAWHLTGMTEYKKVALIAVGGYGRGQLLPHSDVDLLILSKRPLGDKARASISGFITLLWDIGLDIGQSVRTIKECVTLGKEDITIATNLLEARLLTGCAKTFDKLHGYVFSKKMWRSDAFFQAKFNEQQVRHAKFHDTTYNLEPNVKENPGGIRDIQNIGWIAKKHFQALNGKELVEKDYFNDNELEELLECRENLWQFRCALHLVVGRSENRLLFDFQPAVAEMLGYGEGKAAIETMMKAFFRVTRRVAELNQMLLQRFSHGVLAKKVADETPLSDDFTLRDGLLFARHEDVFATPEQVMKTFMLIADTPDCVGFHHLTLRLLRNARRRFYGAYFNQHASCRALFMELIKHPNCFAVAWNLMHKHGIMQAYLKEWDQIVGMMQFDLFHAYTVDEHTHRLIKNIYDYTQPKGAAEFPRCKRIMENTEQPELLYLAAIFHDIGKGRGGDHSQLGAADVRIFAEQHGLNEEQVRLIEWLVANHLTMSVTAQRRDIYDPDVVAEFCQKVKRTDYLDHLYLLTLADIRATNGSLWNDWKASLLRELYLMTRKSLESDQSLDQDFHQRLQKHKNEALKLLAEDNISEADIATFWATLDDSYFVRFKPIQVAWQSAAIHHSRAKGHQQVIEIQENTARGGTEVLIYMPDRPSLFAQVVSIIDSCNCTVHDASINGTHDDYVLDVFIVLDEDGNRITSQSKLDDLRNAITKQLAQSGKIWTNTRKIPRRLKQLDVPTKLRFFQTQAGLTLLELEALDAPGLLVRISKVFVALELSLHMAKITTIGERAEDVFIISNANGQELTQQQQVELKQQLTAELDNAQ